MKMKEINIARTIVKMRREKGLTQEDIANYIGVSKASVSKWETGQSYPDITFLPQLATLFNISIDELMGYEPQMSKEDIRKLYVKLSADFASKPFDEVLNSCRELLKSILLLSPVIPHWIAACKQQHGIGRQGKNPFCAFGSQRAVCSGKTESDDAELVQLSLCMEACCALMMGNPNEVIELLEGTRKKSFPVKRFLLRPIK